MRLNAARRLALLSLLAAAGLLACSSDDDEGEGGPTVRVTDLSGRTCGVENAADVECDELAGACRRLFGRRRSLLLARHDG